MDVFTEQPLTPQTEELRASRHQSAQEVRSRQELDSFRVQNLERMRADVEDRERRLRALSEQLDRDGRMKELERQRSAKQIRQVCKPPPVCVCVCVAQNKGLLLPVKL